jgi:small subunit ribosomal protein S1
VRVISVDDANNRIGLSVKQLEQDPWDDLAVRFSQGALVRGTVTKLTKFGAFASIEGYQDVEGLIHISELSDDRVEHPKDVVHKGDVLTLRVVKVDVKDRRLGLSLRRVNSAEYLDLDMERAYAEMENRADTSAS